MQARPIRQLDPATIAQIAAGEVIERPVSVVKELAENSLDAGAGSIDVDVVDGGRTSIAVGDDGSGIPRGDLMLAFARHATSKLAGADELFSIRTLGFRGEGLASIAAAATVELISRPVDQEIGSRVEASDTSISQPSAYAAPPGTKVVVRDLFARTPARREFVKSPRAEFARISAYLSKLALGWPAVRFSLRHDGADVWTLPAVRDAVDRLEMVFGRGARGALVAIAAPEAHARVKVAGFISKPGNDRANRDGQVLFVNGRLVRSGAIGAAWTAGYGSFGMTGRFPFGVLALQLEPGDVDCNVHPTKIEVRFARANEVFDAVKLAIARTLRSVEPVRQAPAVAFGPAASAREERATAFNFAAFGDRGAESVSSPSALEWAAAPGDGARVYGQIDQTFIVAADRDGLLVIDQHAAHERIVYESILEREGAGDPGAPLLVPQIVTLSDAQAAVLHDHEDELVRAGVSVEPFGERAYRLVALPTGFDNRRFDLTGMLDDLLADDAAREGPAHRNRVLATIACHSVVRAHEPLALQEQATLYQRLRACKDPHTCPHGRPTMLRIDAATLAKAFRRT